MILKAGEIAGMIDLSCVRTISSKADIRQMVDAAVRYGFGHVSVLHGFIPFTRTLLEGSEHIQLVGNVSFPSGSDPTYRKVAQAEEMVTAGCNEIDMVLNIGMLRSGEVSEAAADIREVVDAVRPIPVKVIIEIMYLTPEEVHQACDMCVRSEAAFIKTGTGWAHRGTTIDDVRKIKSLVGDRIKIKASGGIRNLGTLLEMHKAGATRFGVNLLSGIQIVKEALILESGG